MARQSREDRLRRLNTGCCPVHGVGMGQVDGWYYPEGEEPYTIVGCARKDCGITARESRVGYVLSEEFLALLDESAPDPSYIRPATRRTSKRGRPRVNRIAVWSKTDGRCFYCGIFLEDLVTMTIDHVVAGPKPDHSLTNLVPACRSCKCSKGPKSLEEFRFWRSMQAFQQISGVSFSAEQVNYLERIGVKLEIPSHKFWFEEAGERQDGQTRALTLPDGCAGADHVALSRPI